MKITELVNSYLQSLVLKSWVDQVFVIVFLSLLLHFVQRPVLRRCLRADDSRVRTAQRCVH